MKKPFTGGCSGTRPFFVPDGRRYASRLLLAIVVVLLGAAACSSHAPLTNTYESPEAVARAVVEAMRTGDRARLDALALSEQEFLDHVWPDLPAARPERNLPASYVWGDLHQKSNLQLSTTLEQQTGKRYDVHAVTFDDVTAYAHYRVHRKATFRVRGPSGNTDIRVCGSMIEKDGRWKVFSYVID